jgi:hypothetical protein
VSDLDLNVPYFVKQADPFRSELLMFSKWNGSGRIYKWGLVSWMDFEGIYMALGVHYVFLVFASLV